MKTSRLLPILAAGAALLAGGCGHLNTTPAGDPNRVITGTVNFRSELVLPADAVVVVRLLDASPVARGAAGPELPLVDRPKAEPTTQVLGEQTIRAPAPGPVAFRIEYRADDVMLRHGLNLEARISYGGQVRLRTVNTRAVTLSNAADMHEVSVQAVAR